MELGKLKRTTKEKCPYCNSHLQVRTFFDRSIDEEGNEINKERDVVQCPSCEYEEKPKSFKKGNKKENKWR